MANEHPTLKLPPLENWNSQIFAYGFYLDRSTDVDYAGNVTAAAAGRTRNIAEIAEEDIHLLNLNPKAIANEEPLATVVQFTQGGGKFIESRGGVLKRFTIRGTTGLLPPVAPYRGDLQRSIQTQLQISRAPVAFAAPARALGDRDLIEQQELQETSGFAEFYRLRKLFRRFMLARREGRIVQMHYLDFKGDEFWVVEPITFSMERTRFSYNYTIVLNGIEPSESVVGIDFRGRASSAAAIRRSGVTSVLSDSELALSGTQAAAVTASDAPQDAPGLPGSLSAAVTSTDLPTRQANLRINQLRDSGNIFAARFTTGVIAATFQTILKQMQGVQSFFADIAAARRAVLDLPLNLYRQLYSSVRGLQAAIEDNTVGAIREDINEWAMELRFITEGLISHHQRKFGGTPGSALVGENDKFTKPRGQQGSESDLLEEPEGSTGSPAINPFVGSSGFNLIGDVTRQARITALRPENIVNNETIFDVATRTLGDVNRFVDLIVLNKLSPPFIVSDKLNKPPGTLAWGEAILVPAQQDTTSLVSGKPIDAAVTVFEGSVSAAAISTELEDDDKLDPWQTDQWVGFTVELTSGVGLGQTRIIIANDEDTLTVHRAWDTAPVAGDEYRISLVLFERRRKATPETRAFGRDLLVKIDGLAGSATSENTIDLLISPSNDLMTTEGEENFKQAMAVRFRTPQGSNKLHRRYGIADVIGRPLEANVLALQTFFVRQGLFDDPRVDSVERPRFTFDGGALRLEVQVKPIRVQQASLFRVAV